MVFTFVISVLLKSSLFIFNMCACSIRVLFLDEIFSKLHYRLNRPQEELLLIPNIVVAQLLLCFSFFFFFFVIFKAASSRINKETK